jgi:hypothetical protein
MSRMPHPRWDPLEAQDLPLAGLCLHSNGYDHHRWSHLAVLAGFDLSGVDPDVGIGAFERSVSEALDLLIEFLAQLGDIRLLEMPPIPRAFTNSSTLRVETPWT